MTEHIVCPVRGCGRPLVRRDGAYACDAGHGFDIARSGYCNLLQPQDRRSPEPGDSAEALAARLRLHEQGLDAELLATLRRIVDALTLPERPAVLDVGCGPGFLLADLAASRPIAGHGIDLAARAVDRAARDHPGLSWFVVNADRRLPFAEGSFDLVLSITGPKNPEEFRRVLGAGGRLILGIPGPDDLIELRGAVLGRGETIERVPKTLALFEREFELETAERVEAHLPLDVPALSDLLAATYRGARHREARRAQALSPMTVTLSTEIRCLRPRA